MVEIATGAARGAFWKGLGLGTLSALIWPGSRAASMREGANRVTAKTAPSTMVSVAISHPIEVTRAARRPVPS